jgi:hypothetical protein
MWYSRAVHVIYLVFEDPILGLSDHLGDGGKVEDITAEICCDVIKWIKLAQCDPISGLLSWLMSRHVP